jgi:AcrR family transcriptional regulator
MAAARELLVEGLTVSLDHISLEEIIQHAAVPRTSVYRLWPRRDEFVMAFLRELGGADARFGADVNKVAVATAERVIQDHLEWLYDVGGRRALMLHSLPQCYPHRILKCERRSPPRYVALRRLSLSRWLSSTKVSRMCSGSSSIPAIGLTTSSL